MLCHFRKFAWSVLGVIMLGSALSVRAETRSPEPVKVVASFSILADMVEQVGGPLVQVRALVGPNSDAHAFNPTPSDAKALAGADLVVVNGLGFEGWMDRLIKASGFKGRTLVATDGINAIELTTAPDKKEDRHNHDQGHRHSHGKKDTHDHQDGVDPHAWQDLANARIYVANIRDALVQLRPDAAAQIQARAGNYLTQIDALDKTLREQFARIAPGNRRAIVSHDAFAYLARAYDIEFLPVQGWTTSREASASDVAALIRQVREGNVRTYFIENMSDARILERIAQETGARPGGRLYSDALSSPGTEADTYLKLYEVNARRLAEGMGQGGLQ